MIFGIGTDIIEVDRIKDQIIKDRELKQELFTRDEIDYCDERATWGLSYAGRFAAKEAFFKAIGSGKRDGMKYSDIEIINNNLGKPIIQLHDKTSDYCKKNGITDIHVSISHISKFATAFVIVETRN